MTIKLFKKWITDFLSNHENTLRNDWTTEFNTDKFDKFIILESIKASDIKNTKAFSGNCITLTMESTASSSSYNNFKINLKAYSAIQWTDKRLEKD